MPPDAIHRLTMKMARQSLLKVKDPMDLHNLFGRHAADLKASRWDGGRFVSSCMICQREMMKPHGEAWRIVDANGL
jgi:hypothetical protein